MTKNKLLIYSIIKYTGLTLATKGGGDVAMEELVFATRLGLPLFRVNLVFVTSKYIGETEKNLSLLLARTQQTEVILIV